jgi:hypothetical protein
MKHSSFDIPLFSKSFSPAQIRQTGSKGGKDKKKFSFFFFFFTSLDVMQFRFRETQAH